MPAFLTSNDLVVVFPESVQYFKSLVDLFMSSWLSATDGLMKCSWDTRAVGTASSLPDKQDPVSHCCITHSRPLSTPWKRQKSKGVQCSASLHFAPKLRDSRPFCYIGVSYITAPVNTTPQLAATTSTAHVPMLRHQQPHLCVCLGKQCQCFPTTKKHTEKYVLIVLIERCQKPVYDLLYSWLASPNACAELPRPVFWLPRAMFG